MAKGKKASRKPETPTQPSPLDGDNETPSGWLMKALSDLQEDIKGIETRLKRVEITVYGVFLVVLIFSIIFSVIIGPALNTLLKYFLENFELVPKPK